MKRKTLHYSFCEDLGNKKVLDIIWPDKINFALFNITQKMSLGNSKTIPDTDVILPGSYGVEKVSGWTEWKHTEHNAFIAPSDYSSSNIFYVREGKNNDKKPIKIDLPTDFLQMWKEQPHLIEHATFQFYYLNENLFSANLPFLRINESNQIEVDWKIKVSPTGTFLFFRSGHIFFKWKIEVRQHIISMNLIKETLSAITNTAKKALKIFTLGTVDLTGKGDDEIKKLTTDLTSGRDAWEKTGLGKERVGKIQEQHTERFIKSTYGDLLNKTIEPSILYSNTITFPYNLFDYFLRAEKDPFFCRIYFSNNLYNNLVHNNNINPVTYPLNITFSKLAKVLRKGYYQGDLKTAYDPNNFLTTKFKEGVTFFEDMEKDFVDPNLGVKEVADLVKYSSGDGDTYLAEEIREPGDPEEIVTNVSRRKGNDYHQRAHYFIFYEDGTTEHWGCKMPIHNSVGSYTNALKDGHVHGGFILDFSKPVRKMIDVYTCIGCGAKDQGYDATGISNYDNNTGDSLDILIKNLPFEPWQTQFTGATLQSDRYLCPNGKCLGGQADVWEQAIIKNEDNSPFTRAYGFIPDGGTITWRLKTLKYRTRTVLHKVPGSNDWDNLDWNPPTGSGGEIEIPLTEPDFGGLDIQESDTTPEPDFIPDLDPTAGGEPEVFIEPDISIEPDTPEDEFDPPELDIPEVDITPDIPDTDPIDTDQGDHDLPDNDGDIPLDIPEDDNNDHE